MNTTGTLRPAPIDACARPGVPCRVLLARLARTVARPLRSWAGWSVAVTAALLLGACGGGSSSSPPLNVSVVAGDSQVWLYYEASSGVDYWAFYAPDPTISPTNFLNIPKSGVMRNIANPANITKISDGTRLVNGTTYWFTINGRKDSGPGGEGTVAVSATPRSAGGVWSVGSPLGQATLTASAYGTVGSSATPVYVVAGAGGALYSSADGKTWTARSSGVTNDLFAAAYLNGSFVVVGANGVILRSTDGTSWTAVSVGSQPLYAITSASGSYIAAGAGGTVLASPDGITWSVTASAGNVDLRGIAYGSSTYVAVGTGGTLLTSTDLSSWKVISSGTTRDLRSVAFGAVGPSSATTSTWIAVGDQGVILRSTDSASWASVPAPAPVALNGVRFGTQFVAVGAGGTIMVSPDGTAWTVVPVGVTADFSGIGTSGYTFVAVGPNGLNLYSQ